MVHSMGDLLEVEYSEETKIKAYIQTGLIRELTKLGVSLKRIS